MLIKNNIRLALSAIVLLIGVLLCAYFLHTQSQNVDRKLAGDTSLAFSKTSKSRHLTNRTPRSAPEQSPLPLENMSLADNFKELVRLSNSGNAAASMRLYRDLKKCDLRLASMSILNGIYYRSPGQTDENYKLQLREKSEQVPEVEKALSQLDSTETLCRGIDDTTIQNKGEYLRQAALQGDPAAMVCYAASYEFGPPYLSDAWFDYASQWRQDAPYVAQEALNSGQPGVLAPLIEAYFPSNPNGLRFFSFHEAVEPNPQLAYALSLLYARLARGPDLQQTRNNLASLSNMLQPKQLADAQEMADALWPRFQQVSDAGASLVPCPEFLSRANDTIGSQNGQ